MVLRVKPGLGKFSVTALALVLGGVGLGIPALAADQPTATRPVAQQPAAKQAVAKQAAAEEHSCLIVDTDVGLDDYRAFAALLPNRDVRAVVVTEGISGVPGGATAVSMFLASGGDGPPVIAGLKSPTPPDYDWLPAARAGAERINNYLHASVPFAGSPDRMTREVGTAVRGCDRVDVLVLGPWTSYLRYATVLGSNVHVVVSGRSFAENNPDNFNCEYDLAACRDADRALRRARSAVFIDLPTPGEDLTYDPTEAMVAKYDQSGMPGLLRTALQVDPSQWLGTRLWDDAAALYLLKPSKFAPEGKHLEPVVPEGEFRNLLIRATNAD